MVCAVSAVLPGHQKELLAWFCVMEATPLQTQSRPTFGLVVTIVLAFHYVFHMTKVIYLRDRVPITVHKMSPLKAPLTKGVFKEVFLESLFSLQNQEWDPSTGKVSKVLFSQYAKGVLKEVFQRTFLSNF